MSRGSNPSKLEQWTNRLKRFANSGQTVSEFCRAEGVSTPSFYQWRRRLANGQGKQKRAAKRRGERTAFRRLHVSPQPEGASGVRVRLPDGVVLELGSDVATIERIVAQLLDHQAPGAS